VSMGSQSSGVRLSSAYHATGVVSVMAMLQQ
jgi:hypothetical protein